MIDPLAAVLAQEGRVRRQVAEQKYTLVHVYCTFERAAEVGTPQEDIN